MKTGIFEHEGELDDINWRDQLLMASKRELKENIWLELWPVSDIRELMALTSDDADLFATGIRSGDIPSKANGEAVEPVVAICWGLRHGKQAAAMYQPYLNQKDSARLRSIIESGEWR